MSVELAVSLFDTHLHLIDKVVKEGNCGKSREEVLRNVVLEHAKDLLGGEVLTIRLPGLTLR